MTAGLAFDLVEQLAPRIGRTDVPCPLCPTFHNPRRRVLRIWRDEHFAGFHCVRCGEKGFARNGGTANAARPPPDRLAAIRQEAAERDASEQIQRQRTASFLWSRRRPVEDTPAETYLRQARHYSGRIPATLGYLPGAESTGTL
jgi:hypothetical protein